MEELNRLTSKEWKAMIEMIELLNFNTKKSFDEYLIAEVKSRPIIYNSEDPDFGHKKKTNTAWRQVAGCIKLDVATVKVRWQELIDRFVEEYNVETPETDKSRLFKKMEWMAPHIQEWKEPQQTKPNSDKELILLEEKEAEIANDLTDKTDFTFMLCIREEMKKIPRLAKLKFKSDVFKLIHKCAEMDNLL